MTIDELAELIFEDLGLPNLRPKASQEIPSDAVNGDRLHHSPHPGRVSPVVGPGPAPGRARSEHRTPETVYVEAPVKLPEESLMYLTGKLLYTNQDVLIELRR